MINIFKQLFGETKKQKKRRIEYELNMIVHDLSSLPIILDELREYNIKGTLRKAESCPIAQYFQRRMNYENITAGYKDVIYWLENDYVVVAYTYDHPIHSFVTKFDQGQYPEFILNKN